MRPRRASPFSPFLAKASVPLTPLSLRRQGSEDADFEDRLAKLRAAKGTKGRGQGGTKAKATEAGKPKKVYDYTGETVFYEGKPSAGDLAVNVALGATLLWLVSDGSPNLQFFSFEPPQSAPR